MSELVVFRFGDGDDRGGAEGVEGGMGRKVVDETDCCCHLSLNCSLSRV